MIYCVLYKDPIACLIRSLLSVTEGPQFSQMKRVGKEGEKDEESREGGGGERGGRERRMKKVGKEGKEEEERREGGREGRRR